MNIKATLEQGHNKRTILKIRDYVKADAKKFTELMKLFLSNDYRLAQRSSWAVNYCADKYPNLILPYLGKMILNLQSNSVHDAVRRNTLRTMQFIEIPTKYLGIVTNNCFQILLNNNEPVAIRVFAMTVLFNISKKEQEIKNELKMCIEQILELPHKPAMASRGKKFLIQLQK